MNTKYLIDVWQVLEDKHDNASIVLINSLDDPQNNCQHRIKQITISNNNDMKYLYVYLNDNFYQSYTHIHSFVNDMTSMYGKNIFFNFTLSCNNDKVKRKHTNDNKQLICSNDNKIKRMKYDYP